MTDKHISIKGESPKEENHKPIIESSYKSKTKGSSEDKEKKSDKLICKENSREIEDKPETNHSINSLIEYALIDLKAEREQLKNEIKELLNKKKLLEKDLKNSFLGQSDEIARKVKGFEDYLTGALQNLVNSTEQLNLIEQPLILKPSPLDKNDDKEKKDEETMPTQQAISDTFKPDEELIRSCFEQFLGQPDFYADPWKLRRSLEKNDINLLEDWFFSMGGRGAQPSRGSRTKNILVSAGLISILGELYGERFQSLILASQPERLGEWRRGLQDGLGLGREDFGPNSGIVLFERADGLIERADRLEENGDLPLIIIDGAERTVDTPILQFPIWLAFSASQEELFYEEEFLQ